MRRSFLLSAILHLFIFSLCILLFKFRSQEESQKKPPLIVELTPPKNDRRPRVVQTDSAEKVAQAEKNAFLGWQNQRTDRETVSKRKDIVMGSPSKALPSKVSPLKKSESKSLSKLGVRVLPAPSQPENDQPVWATPGTRPQDSIPGIKESEKTALNTKEYIFYSYFQRIRERLDQAWVPILRAKLERYYRAGRELASDMDHTTHILVVLNLQGEIVQVRVLSESGVQVLDDAAVEAFNRAGPFPNPPTGMIDLNKQVQVPWDFILRT